MFFYLNIASDVRMEMSIQDISESDTRLVSIKIPINLPYLYDWKEYEDVRGEISYKGDTYKCVKRKVYRDSLVLLCVKNTEKSRIQKKSDDYFKKVNSLTANSSKKSGFKECKADYFQEVKEHKNTLSHIEHAHKYLSYKVLQPKTGHLHSISIPPESEI